MSEETKNTAPQPEETAPEAETVTEPTPAEQPAEAAEQPAEETAGEAEAAAEEGAEPKKGFFGKKAAKELEAAKAKAEAAEAAAAAAKDQWLRTAAEYDNFRRRSAVERDAAFNNGVGFAVTQILTILDTLEMAANAPCADDNYKKGVVMTLDKAAAALAALKVEEIPAQDQPFDPNLHNAVMQQPAAEGQESGTVVQVFQKGYRIGERIIRHATVVVAE